MTPRAEKYVLSVVGDITDIAAGEWNRLASREEYSPFLEHEFLASAEMSGCASPETGWYPRHFVLRRAGRRSAGRCPEDQIIAAAPLYAKTHSMGEFIFDQGLAQAVIGMGIRYYPKLVATLPFTPSPGYRFLLDPDCDEHFLTQTLFDGIKTYRDKTGLASHSLLFLDPAWDPERIRGTCDSPTEDSGEFLRWAHQYYVWENDSYRDFEDYLGRFNKNQRRNIRRERQSLSAGGLAVEVLTGSKITEKVMSQMYDLYRSTNEKFGPWAAFFLNREWFADIGRRWSDRIVIFSAGRSGASEPTAMSLVVRKNRQMIGRYWGCTEYIPNLHFELCCYAPIEFAIREKVAFFDPGMGSPHKVRRGFRSREFLSAHSFADAQTSTLFGAVLAEANREEREFIRELDESIPWNRTPAAP